MCAYSSALGGVSGLASGINWRDIMDSLLAVERKPIAALRQRETAINAKLAALRSVNSLVLALKNRAFNLSLRANVLAKSAKASGGAVTATATPEAVAGSHDITVYRLATATKVSSTAHVGTAVDVGVPLGRAGMAVIPTTGFFTVNGVRIAIDASTTLDAGSNSITSLINGAGLGITASMELDSSGRYNLLKLYRAEGSIYLGGGADTSNFLAAARLFGTDPRSTWTSGAVEGAVEGTVAHDVSADATVTFTYSGNAYVTEAGSLSATAGVTTLEELATALQNALNAKLNGKGSVTVGVIDPSGAGNGRLVITDDRTGGSISVSSLGGTEISGLQPLLLAGGATQGETIVSSANLGTASAGDYLFSSRLAATLKDSWLSGRVESSGVAGKAGFDLAGTETLSFAYHGASYETGPLAAATADVTDLADVAADLEAKMNAALGTAGSVTVKVYDPDGTGNARLVVTDDSPTGGSEASFHFTEAPAGMRLVSSEGAEAKGLIIVNDAAVTYDKYRDTLNSLLARINSSGAGVSAAYDSLGDRVSMTSLQTGSASVYLEDVGGNVLAALNLTGEGAQTRGSNARFSVNTVNGGQVMTSASNTVSGVIAGVTLQLRQASALNGDGSYVPTTLTIEQDTGKAVEAVKEFVAAYNALVEKLAEYTKYDPKTKGAGILNGVSQARELLRRLKAMVGYAAQGLDGYPMTLREIGIGGGGSSAGMSDLVAGKLALDEGTLSAALLENGERVFQILAGYTGSVSLMAGGTGSVSSASGRPSRQAEAGTYRIVSDDAGNLEAHFTPTGGVETFLGAGSIRAGGSNSTLIPGVTLYAKTALAAGTDYLSKPANLTGVLKALELFLGEVTESGGVIRGAEDRMKRQVEDIQKQVERLEDRMESYEARLIRQYTAMETLLSAMTAQSQWLTNQVNVINRNWSGTR